MATQSHPWRLKRYEQDRGYRVVVIEVGPLAHAPRRFRTVHTLGYVLREGSFGWTAQRPGNKAAMGGYATRAAAADVLFENWRCAGNTEVRLDLSR